MANKKQGKQDKEKIIADLYALRAGLSAISIEKDKVDVFEQNKENLKNDVEVLKEQKDSVQKHLNKVDARQETYKKKRARVNIKEFFKNLGTGFLISFCLFCGIGIIFLAGELVLAVLDGLFKVKNLERVENIFIIVMCVLIGIDILIMFGFVIYKRVQEKKEYKNDRKNAYSENITSIEIDLRSAERKYLEAKQNLKSNLAVQDNEIKMCVQNANDVNKVLETSFSSIIHPADWENLDLVIYYLQTGRADSIKEALNLVDRQKQTDAIINEIKFATANITNEVRRDFSILGNVMVDCFQNLGNQIESYHKETVSKLSEISDQNEKIIQLNKNQIETTCDLEKALKEKSGITSEQLKADLHYLQEVYGFGSK